MCTCIGYELFVTYVRGAALGHHCACSMLISTYSHTIDSWRTSTSRRPGETTLVVYTLPWKRPSVASVRLRNRMPTGTCSAWWAMTRHVDCFVFGQDLRMRLESWERLAIGEQLMPIGSHACEPALLLAVVFAHTVICSCPGRLVDAVAVYELPWLRTLAYPCLVPTDGCVCH